MRSQIRASVLFVFAAGCGACSRSARHEPGTVVVADAREAPANSLARPTPPGAIPNTDVPDSPENRGVLEFCERYRTALEARDSAALLALASPRYLDDGGTPDPADDTSYAELQSYLQGMFKDVEQVRYEIRYRSVRPIESDRVVVGLTYSATFRIAGQFRRSVQDNELLLERQDGSYRFLSGM